MNSTKVTDIIKIVDPVKVVDITEKGFDFVLMFSVLVAVISTSIMIWDRIKRSKVYGKVISKTCAETGTFSYTTQTKEARIIKGQHYFLKLSLSCLGKSLNYKDVHVLVTYGDEKVVGEIYWARFNHFNFINSDGTSSEMQIVTPADKFLTFNSVLEQDKTSFFYLNFIVPNKCGSILYDKLELKFIKPDNKTINVEIFEIDAKQFFFDENLIKN